MQSNNKWCRCYDQSIISPQQLPRMPQEPAAPHISEEPQQPPAGNGDGDDTIVLCADINFVRSVLLQELQCSASFLSSTRISLTAPHFPHRYS